MARVVSARREARPPATGQLNIDEAPGQILREIRAIREYSVRVEILNAHRQHPRRFEQFKYVYPVLSRRSHGISIGLNVNPDKVCNFDCIYCQVDRSIESAVKKFDLKVAEAELREMVDIVGSGEIAQHEPFNSVPPEMLRLNDVALSGDAEPTALRNFAETMAMVARVKPSDAKIVLITDAGGLDRAEVKRGLEIMDANNGEIWAKLDAGTEEYFQLINHTKIPFARIVNNITQAATVRPIVIQSLFLKIRGQGPSRKEIGAYCQRLGEIGDFSPAGHGIKLVQVYTIARKAMTIVDGVPAWEFVSALTHAEVDGIARRVRKEAGVTAEGFYG